jgi:hypothetical protein
MRTYLVRILDEIWEHEGTSEQDVLDYFRKEFECSKLRLRILEK